MLGGVRQADDKLVLGSLIWIRRTFPCSTPVTAAYGRASMYTIMGAELMKRGKDKRAIRDMPPSWFGCPIRRRSKLPLTTKSVAVYSFFLPLVVRYERPTWPLVGGRIRGSPGSRPDLTVCSAREDFFVRSLRTAESTAGRRDGGTMRTHSSALLLIELTFCLGSIWAKLELAFLASVKFIIQRIQCVSWTPSLFCSCIDQMNVTHLYNCNVCPPDSHCRYEKTICKVARGARPPCVPHITFSG